MYINLLTEMSRKNVSIKDLSNKLEIKHSTLEEKLNGKNSFSIEEAIKIRQEFFSEFNYEYLFF